MDAVDFKEKPSMQCNMKKMCLAIDDRPENENRLMACGGKYDGKGLVQMWDYCTGLFSSQFAVDKVFKCICAKEKLVAVGCQCGELHVIGFEQPNQRWKVQISKKEIKKVQFSQKLNLIAACCSNNEIFLVDYKQRLYSTTPSNLRK